ncbi:MAG: hypothetical protein Ct9H300mP6_08460 [Gammaproteobacteria bacterium]|nr:MAG: hypothetical protein Ct9H300mP6_08460 [Gammaproteobacteria bacterium]
MEQSENQIEEGIEICAGNLKNQFQEIDGVHGAHLMAPRNLSAIAPTVKKAGKKDKGLIQDLLAMKSCSL